jgi:hypothetical protein
MLMSSPMKTKQAPATQFQSIDVSQLDTVIGGCACGCGQDTCNCANGSCGAGAQQQRQPRFGQ